MKNTHHESLNRILKKLEVARDSNIKLSQLPEVKDTAACTIYLIISHVFQTSMGFIDAEIEMLDKSKNKRIMRSKEKPNVSR